MHLPSSGSEELSSLSREGDTTQNLKTFERLQKAGLLQPFALYRSICDLWAEDEPLLPLWMQKSSWIRSDPLLSALCALFPGSCVKNWNLQDLEALELPLSFAKLYELVLLWNLSGRKQEALELSHWLHSMANPPLFWAEPEQGFEEERMQNLYALWQEVAGLSERLRSFTGFYGKIQRLSSRLEGGATIDSNWGTRQFQRVCNDSMRAFFTPWGQRTALGVVQSKGSLEIRAMGPQALPLHLQDTFGILQRNSASSAPQWTCAFADPEVWLEILPSVDADALSLSVRFVGVQESKPLAFAFYICADCARIGESRWHLGELRHYRGDSCLFVFENATEQMIVKRAGGGCVQLIPLSGQQGFWQSHFLLALELLPGNSTVSFTLQFKSRNEL